MQQFVLIDECKVYVQCVREGVHFKKSKCNKRLWEKGRNARTPKDTLLFILWTIRLRERKK